MDPARQVIKFPSKYASHEPNDPHRDLRESARRVTQNDTMISESFTRVRVVERPAPREAHVGDADIVLDRGLRSSSQLRDLPERERTDEPPNNHQRRQPRAAAITARAAASRMGRKIVEDFEDGPSPTMPTFAAEITAPSASTSRAATPGVSRPPLKRARIGPRIKSS